MQRMWAWAALFCALAPGSFGAGWQTAPELTGAWYAAFASESPYAELIEAGLPLPPTRADVAKLSAVEFERQQTAIKQVLLTRGVRTFAEFKRVSSANLLAAARKADEWGAPHQLSTYFRLLAGDTLSNRQRYLVQAAVEGLLSAYLVDELQMRYFVELSALSEEDLETVFKWLPLQAFFNLVPVVQDEATLVADYQLLCSVYAQLHAAYASAQDKDSADAAADAALQALVLHESTAYTRLFAPQEIKARLAPRFARSLAEPTRALLHERKRLREHEYFGSLRLRLLDLLLS